MQVNERLANSCDKREKIYLVNILGAGRPIYDYTIIAGLLLLAAEEAGEQILSRFKPSKISSSPLSLSFSP